MDEVYRHENKYEITASDYYAIKSRISLIMKHDSHSQTDGRYTVNSIYFDNYRDKALFEKINGVKYREKFRIRFYNNDFSFIVLEKKIKNNNLCMKLDCQISMEEYTKILSSPGDWMLTSSKDLIKELYCKMKTQQLKPRVLVSYLREPYIYEPGNVRVTFDSQIRSHLLWQMKDGCLSEAEGIKVCDETQNYIMEVKFDAFMPEIINDLLQTGNLRQQAFSKYSSCRRFG